MFRVGGDLDQPSTAETTQGKQQSDDPELPTNPTDTPLYLLEAGFFILFFHATKKNQQ